VSWRMPRSITSSEAGTMSASTHLFAVAWVAGSFLQPVPLPAQTLPHGSGWGATMVIEPVIIAHGGFSAPCNPRAAAQAGWGVDQIEKLVSPSGPQQAALAALKSAVTKAADTSAGVCPAQIPRSAQERLVFLEKRLAALREAVHVVVPAFEAFHASLNDEQKARLDSGPRGWRWPRSPGD
jgi:LTXXQ motif family protein